MWNRISRYHRCHCCYRNRARKLISTVANISLSSINDQQQSSFRKIRRDLTHFSEEYLKTINHYRSNLCLLPLQLSNALKDRAVQRATQLALENQIESSDPVDLIYKSKPLGET